MSLSEPFNGPALLGIQIFPQDPLKFSFILGQGERPLDETSIRAVSEKSIRYFLAGLAIPEQDLWVNLSPYESDRIISDVLGKTEIGQDMLAQDYILKQLAASLTYPESDLGKKFWDTVNQKAYERFGDVDIPMDIFNKVWIIPNHSVVYETADRAVVAEAKLKVMLEEDYLAMQRAHGKSSDNEPSAMSNEPNPIAQEVMREIVIPLLEQEVNEGSHFAPLRQIYHALVLSSWFKDKLKMNAVAQVYGNQKKISGIVSPDQQAVEQVYQEYLKAYQIGAYDYIKEEAVQESGEIIPRRYFSGGERWDKVSATRRDVALLSEDEFTRRISPILGKVPLRADARLNPLTRPASIDQAMLTAKDPILGTASFLRIQKPDFNPEHARMIATLMGLDYLIQMLDEMYDSKTPVVRIALRIYEAIHGKQVRTTLRELINEIHAEFNQYQTLKSRTHESRPDVMKYILDILNKNDRGLQQVAFEKGGKSLYDIVTDIIENPYVLPNIHGLDQERFDAILNEQRDKFQKTYDFMLAQWNQTLEQTPPSERLILEGYTRMLNEAKNLALKKNGLSAIGYVNEMIVFFDQFRSMAGDPKILSTMSDVYERAGTIFKEVMLRWHWHTKELRGIINQDSGSENQRALAKTNKYWRSLTSFGQKISESSPKLRRIADISYQYISRVRSMLQAINETSQKGQKDTTHSYRWIVLEQAMNETLKMKSDTDRAEFQPLLTTIARTILAAAEVELPDVEQYKDVNIYIDGRISPDYYQALYTHFKEKLRNIITTKGTITSHYAFLAAADGVGVIVVDKNDLPAEAGTATQVTVRQEEGRQFSLNFTAAEESAVEQDTLSKANMQKVFDGVPDSYVTANADTVAEAGRANNRHAKAIGLMRTENQLGDGDLPTRDLYKKRWGDMAKAFPGKKIRIRALDWKSDKMSVLLSHIKYNGKKMYLEHPLGREIVKEQFRALLDLANEGIDIFEFMFPMVEDETDIKQIRQLLDEVLAEDEFKGLTAKIPTLGIMIETQKALDNIDLFVNTPWIQFFSIGTNDLISELYRVSRDDPSANYLFERVNPKIVRAIEMVVRKAAEKGKPVSVCGELASKQRFWIVRDQMRLTGNTEIGISMPANDIPVYNGAAEILSHDRNATRGRALYESVRVILDQILTTDTNVDPDTDFAADFNRALETASSKIDTALDVIVSNFLGLRTTPSNENEKGPEAAAAADNAMITSRADQRRLVENTDPYGGVDFTQYRDSMTVSQNSQTATVPLPDGKTITIGGPDFAGFTFDIIQIVPYTVSPGM